MKTAMMILGVLCTLVGLLWMGQGAGIVRWPETSFMIAQTQWIIWGAVVAAIGVGLIWLSRRRAA